MTMIYNCMHFIIINISQCDVAMLIERVYKLMISFKKVLKLAKLTVILGNVGEGHKGAPGVLLVS